MIVVLTSTAALTDGQDLAAPSAGALATRGIGGEMPQETGNKEDRGAFPLEAVAERATRPAETTLLEVAALTTVATERLVTASPSAPLYMDYQLDSARHYVLSSDWLVLFMLCAVDWFAAC